MSEKVQAALFFTLFGLACGLMAGSIIVGVGVPFEYIAIPAMLAICGLLFWQ